MNENLNLVEILKDCPKGTKLYSTIYGEIKLYSIEEKHQYPIIFTKTTGYTNRVTADGRHLVDYNGECTLFPSKGQRDWSKFTAPWYKKEKLVELKESDEKIRRWIIDDIRYNINNELLNNSEYKKKAGKAIAWLENQGEQNLPSANERAWLYLVSDVLTWKDGIGQYLDDPRVQELAKRLYSKYAQKSTDKIEPKFYVGQYITDGYVGGQITSIEDNYHCYKILDFMGGTNTTIPFTLQDNYHLWTIQDAMDGDVLLSPSTPEGDKECPFIFKEIDKDGIVRFHAALLQSESIKISDGITNVMGYANAGYHTPATKEQRDAMMKAMNDAGYEWDADKKELKKLVHNRFDPKTLQPYDKVLVRDASVKCWRCSFFSHKNVNTESSQYKYATPDNSYVYCIPYNDETKHLVGTTEEAPEFYRY